MESKSKQPIFFNFNRILQNQESGIDFDLFIREFQENFELEQLEYWTKFWSKKGEEHVLQTWNEKYKDYLKTEKETEVLEETISLKEANKDYEEETSAKVTEHLETPRTDADTLQEKSWDDLWHEHREEIYCEQYLIFTTIFYNYFLDLKKSCETPQAITEEEKEEDETIAKLTEELEQLENLGLPTSFGGRPQRSSNKHKSSSKTIHYSDFFSDSEMENESSDSDIEDCDKDLSPISTKEDEDSLHCLQQKSISTIQKRKRNRKLKNVPPFILEEKGLLKYWRKRFSLFSRFDEGIRLDRS